ncbi:hypothetical protein NDU88_005785 [Pleurodeles waltl]|uniref:Uncharacterized protein n=1 Tax=Pleurodeles waltl TaxID=8319 RepID=A0AAV7RPZ5_PLEWA|nr:hypothetical protein NDU88_005785 [Pleurodeles waltl]
MTRDKDPKPPRQGCMDCYTKVVTHLSPLWTPPVVPDNAALQLPIQASWEVLEGRVGEVGDLRKVAEKVTLAETRILDLENTVRNLSKEMAETRVLNKDIM